MILVDTNILLDILDDSSQWAPWSQEQFARARLLGAVCVNEIVYAELAARFAQRTDVDNFLDDATISLSHISRDALFLAAQAFRLYRRQGGPRNSILPDFFIGAHAAAEGHVILTRDTRRYDAYFPDVELIAPGLR